ncbi:MAG: alpha/beta hydrolase [Bacteroidales bacterium]|jgi:acetyl esterase/lipase|nr:alpha/beta hydrolase [Bacteroidales bacterium]
MNKLQSILYFIFFFGLSVSAQESFKIWEGANMTHKQKQSKLTVFLPEKPDTSDISVIICPGGSYYWLDKKNEGYEVAKYLNKHGITAFVLQYRTARKGNHYPAMIEDLEQAMKIVKTNAKEYGIAPQKVGVMGFSAGGHLVGTLAIYHSKPTLKPYFTAMIYPVVSMEDSICHTKSRKNLLGKEYPQVLAEKMSLEKNVYGNMSPVFLLHCIGDQTVDYRNSVVFDKALTEKKVPHTFLLLDECGMGGHGFGIQPNGKATGWIDEFLQWVKSIKN